MELIFEDDESVTLPLYRYEHPFQFINWLNERIRENEDTKRKKVKLAVIGLNVGKLHDDAVKFLTEHYKVKLTKVNGTGQLRAEMYAAPEEINTYVLAVTSGLAFGEKLGLQTLQTNEPELEKRAARERAKVGSVRRDCLLVQKIAELNGSNIETTINLLRRMGRADIKLMLQDAYTIVYGEEVVKQDRNPKDALFNMTPDEILNGFKKGWYP